MKKLLMIDCLIIFVATSLGFFLNNPVVTGAICGAIGVVCFLLLGLISGAFVSGDRNRANREQDQTERVKRDRLSTWLLVLGLPNLIVAVITIWVF